MMSLIMKSDIIFHLEHFEILEGRFQIYLKNEAEETKTREPLVTHIFNTYVLPYTTSKP